LNSASFGRRVTGAESAARVYFGKSSSEINAAEAALLAGLTTAPALNPHDSPQAAADLLHSTLDRLETAGVYSAETKQEALSTELTIVPPISYTQSISPAFTRLALQQLSALVSEDRAALGGLQIRTTLDLVQQAQLDCTIRAQLGRLEATGTNFAKDCAAARLLPALPPMESPMSAGVHAAGILLDPARGEILALSGKTSLELSTDIYENMQGGTVLNPFLAAAAFSRGYSPASLVWDLPQKTALDAPLLKDTALQYRGPIRLRTALISDRLNPLENLLNQLGARNTWRLARPLGFDNLENVQNPEKLLEGGASVSLVEVAQGMAVFANQGDLYGLQTIQGATLQPSTLLAVEDSYGQPLLEDEPVRKQSVLSSPLAYLVHHVLADETIRRTEMGYPNPFELGRPAGAKFGNADNGKEIWAAGYTPQRATVIWMGAPPESSFSASLGIKAVGGIWNAVMRQSLTDQPATDWTMPLGVTKMEVCDPSGLLPTKICPSRVTEVFLQGSEPNSADDLYKSVGINRETGHIATVFTPPDMLEEGVFLAVPEFARDWARAAGKNLPPTDYDTIQAGAVLPTVKIDKPVLFSLVSGKVIISGTAGGDGFQNFRLQVGEGLNPQQWFEIAQGNIPILDGQLGEWDTTGKNGLYAIRLLVVRVDNRVETALSQVTVDNLQPVINIISPQENTAVSGAKPVFMQAEISDSSGIARVEWQIDSNPVGESKQAPYIFEWNKPVRGSHTLTVTATDAANNQGTSKTLTFFVE
jgi:membrane peptidoglycan carboxypeptidase